MTAVMTKKPSKSSVFAWNSKYGSSPTGREPMARYQIAQERVIYKNGETLLVVGVALPEWLGDSSSIIEIHDKKTGKIRGYRCHGVQFCFVLSDMSDFDARKLGFHNAAAALKRLKEKFPALLPQMGVSWVTVASRTGFVFDKDNRPEFIQDILAAKANTR